MTTDRIAKNEATARRLLAAGFTTKSGQKEAKELVSRAYDGARDLVQSIYLAGDEQARKASEDAYWVLPYALNNYRAKHGDVVIRLLPAAAEHVVTIARLFDLYKEIAAAPVNLAPRNPDGTKVRVPHRSEAHNPELREQFMAQAPALAAAYDQHIRAVFRHHEAGFGVGGVIPATLFPGTPSHKMTEQQQDQQAIVSSTIARHGELVKAPVRGWRLDPALLAREAEKYGEEVAMQWFYKTNRKLGELQSPELVKDDNGEVIVRGAKAGKLIAMHQQVVSKWAHKTRKVFHQFPARIYVNGRFTPEAAYAREFDVKA